MLKVKPERVATFVQTITTSPSRLAIVMSAS
jgi:hypothetical protein